MCCASAEAERRGGVLCAGPAYVKKKRRAQSRLRGHGEINIHPPPEGILTYTPPRLPVAPPLGLDPPPERASSPIRPKGVELAFKLITFSISC